MRKIFFLAAILFVSGCTNISETIKAGLLTVDKSTEDILVHAELSQPQLKSGMSTNIKFTAENKQQFELKNFALNVFDLCDFTCTVSGSSTEAPQFSADTIRPNRTKDFQMNCKAPVVESERTCEIKFRSSYEGSLGQTHDIFVVTESEFATGRTKVSPLSTETKSPLKISVSWSDTQPFVENDDAILYLDYSYTGEGIIEKLRPGDVSFVFPKNLELEEGRCIDFVKSEIGENNYTLAKDLLFIAGKAKRSTCVFKTKASQPIDSGKLSLKAKFKYTLDGSLPVTVVPKKSI